MLLVDLVRRVPFLVVLELILRSRDKWKDNGTSVQRGLCADGRCGSRLMLYYANSASACLFEASVMNSMRKRHVRIWSQ